MNFLYSSEGYERGYGCTADFIFSGEKNDVRELIITDWKTSKNLYNSHTIQMTGIKKAVIEEGKIPGAENAKLWIVQFGLNGRVNKKYKVNEVPYRWDMLLNAYGMWAEENKDAEPEQKEFPTQVTINLNGVRTPDGVLYETLINVPEAEGEPAEATPETHNEGAKKSNRR